MNDASPSQPQPSSSSSAAHNDTPPPTGTSGLSPRQLLARNRKLFNKKREVLAADLQRQIDILIYAQLSALYYMDTAFLVFLPRALLQFTFLTPKPSLLPDPPPSARPIGLILLANLLAALFHAFSERPFAGESTRGYLHGGLAMDFIGQRASDAGRARLVLMDLLVLALQVVCFGVGVVRRRAREGAVDQPVARERGGQTVEFEERGELAVEHRPGDVELRELNADGVRARGGNAAAVGQGADESTATATEGGVAAETSEAAALLQGEPRTDAYLFDAFNSGEAVIGHFSLARIISDQILVVGKQDGLSSGAVARGPGADVEQQPGGGDAATPARPDLRAAFRSSYNLGFRLGVGGRTYTF